MTLLSPKNIEKSQSENITMTLIRYGCYFGLKVRPEIRFPIQVQGPFHFSIPFDTLHVLSSPREMQNCSEGSVNPEVIRVWGLNRRFLQSWKLNILFARSIGQESAFSGHTYFVFVGDIRALKSISLKLNRKQVTTKATDLLLV